MYGTNVLIAEDEERLRKLVVKYLKLQNYNVFEAENGKEAVDLFEEQVIDIAILDIMMPEMDGWMVCKKIRAKSDIPIIMLTARAEEGDKLFGFDLGVDDYVTKPFSTRELVARIKALLKRTGKKDVQDEINIGSMKIHFPSRQVTVDGEGLNLSPKEYDLLIYFINNANHALSREQILNRIWGYDFFGDDRNVDTVIKRLRKKLKAEGQRIITVRSVGYRFEVDE
jgi:DNA-binding response OmpR family regulator